MPLWNVVLMFLLLIGLVAYHVYRRESEGFTAGIRQKLRPLLRNIRRKQESMSKHITKTYEKFRR